jgi:hypothetical protein
MRTEVKHLKGDRLMTFKKLYHTVGQFQAISADPDDGWNEIVKSYPHYPEFLKLVPEMPEFMYRMKEIGYGTIEEVKKRIKYALAIGHGTLGSEVVDYMLNEGQCLPSLTALAIYEVEGSSDSVFDAQTEILLDLMLEIAVGTHPSDPGGYATKLLDGLPIDDEEYRELLRFELAEGIAHVGVITFH